MVVHVLDTEVFGISDVPTPLVDGGSGVRVERDGSVYDVFSGFSWSDVVDGKGFVDKSLEVRVHNGGFRLHHDKKWRPPLGFQGVMFSREYTNRVSHRPLLDALLQRLASWQGSSKPEVDRSRSFQHYEFSRIPSMLGVNKGDAVFSNRAYFVARRGVDPIALMKRHTLPGTGFRYFTQSGAVRKLQDPGITLGALENLNLRVEGLESIHAPKNVVDEVKLLRAHYVSLLQDTTNNIPLNKGLSVVVDADSREGVMDVFRYLLT